jgi:hypothetical protein
MSVRHYDMLLILCLCATAIFAAQWTLAGAGFLYCLALALCFEANRAELNSLKTQNARSEGRGRVSAGGPKHPSP